MNWWNLRRREERKGREKGKSGQRKSSEETRSTRLLDRVKPKARKDENSPRVVPDLQRSSSVHVPSELRDSGGALVGSGELDDSLTSRSTGVHVEKDLSGNNLPGSLEELNEILVRGRPRKLDEKREEEASVRVEEGWRRMRKTSKERQREIETHVVDQDLLGRVVGSGSPGVSESISTAD